jgi:hypothetical protein
MKLEVHITREDVVEDARELAALTGASIEDAVARAVRAQVAVERVKADAVLSKSRERALELLGELRRLPAVGPALMDEDLYGADGLPSELHTP